jgi:hypothetical protein
MTRLFTTMTKNHLIRNLSETSKKVHNKAHKIRIRKITIKLFRFEWMYPSMNGEIHD